MRKCLLKGISLALALVLVLTVLPAVAPKAEAAVGDISDEGLVIFEEDFSGYTGPAGFINNYSGSSYQNSNCTLSFPEDGVLRSTAKKAGTNAYIDLNLSGFDIPKTNAAQFYLGIKIDVTARVSGATAQLQLNSTTVNGNAAFTGNLDNTTANTSSTSTDWATITSIGYSTSAITSLKLRLTMRSPADTTSYIEFDSIKISLVMREGTGEFSSFQPSRTLEAGNGYAKLLDNVNLNRTVDMGDNAVLDLNGKTLTIPSGMTLNGGVNSKIVDTSAEQTGKIVCDEGAIVFTNPDHTTLPLRTSDGYVFASPKLIKDSHYLVSNTSADGFTLQFRPGFGTLSGETVREAYLASGNSGISMNVDLEWTDVLGTPGKTEQSLGANDMIQGADNMYSAENKCGQITLTGAQEFKQIKVIISLESCGVTTKLDPIVFDNNYVTVHYGSAETWQPNGATKSLDFVGGAIPTGDAAANKVLVIDLDYRFTDISEEPTEYMALCFRNSSNSYCSIISLRGCQNDAGILGYITTTQAGNLSNSDGIHIRYVVDLGTGEYRMYVGDDYREGTFNTAELAVLDDYNKFYFKSATGATNLEHYYFDNVVIYTMDKTTA